MAANTHRVDPNANPLVRGNARIFLAWQSLNKQWSGNVRSTPAWWVVWELTWPLLVLSTVGLWIYWLVTTPIVSVLDFLW